MNCSTKLHHEVNSVWKNTIFALYLVAMTGVGFAHAGETTNKIGITLVDIPAGSFAMGTCDPRVTLTAEQAAENKKRIFLGQAPITVGAKTCLAGSYDPEKSTVNSNEVPQHKVSIRAFQMGKTKVTLGQFKQFIVSANRNDLVDDLMQNNTVDSEPVVHVAWNTARDFINWLNKTDGGGYRLPSDSEWEYACRAGGYHERCGTNTQIWDEPAGKKQINTFGLIEMSTGVGEMVQDCFHEDYVGAPIDGSAWMSKCSNSDAHILRGGSAAQRRNVPDSCCYKDIRIGFRVARSR